MRYLAEFGSGVLLCSLTVVADAVGLGKVKPCRRDR